MSQRFLAWLKSRFNMTRLTQMTGKKLIRALETLGFVFIRQKGSHAFLKHPITGRATVVPLHAGEDIDRSLLRSILREIDVSPEEFFKVLRK